MRRSVQWNVQRFAKSRYAQVSPNLDLGNRIQEGQLLLAALKACSVLRDSEAGRVVHAAVILDEESRWNKYVETAIIDMYSKCGEMVEARRVFDAMPVRDVVPWNALIFGYVTNGETEAALESFTRITCSPDALTFVAAFMACSSQAGREDGHQADGRVFKPKCLEQGFSLHCEAAKRGFGSDMFVCNSLIDMYVKCGSLVNARIVFDRMEAHDVVSWTSLILGNAENGECHLALYMFDCMVGSGCVPNARTFVAALVACAGFVLEEEEDRDAGVKLSCLAKAMKLHSSAAKLRFHKDIFVASTLVDLYAKCGSLWDAYKVFAAMPYHDVVTWNALMLGYVVNGDSELALDCFEWMKREGCVPDSRSFVAVLMASSGLAAREEGKLVDGRVVKVQCLERVVNIHSEAERLCDSDMFLASGLVDVYAKCGSMVDAAAVFTCMNRWTVASWNSMMQGYVSCGQSDLALGMFWRLNDRDDGFAPDSQSFVAALVACSSLAAREAGIVKVSSLDKGGAVHAQAVKLGFDTDLFVASTLVDMYGQCGRPVTARMVFDGMPCPNSVTWNSLLLAYANNGEGETVLQLFQSMASQGCVLNERAFVACLVACGSLGQPEEKHVKLNSLRLIHSKATSSLCDSNIFVANTLVDMYAKCGSAAEARAVFDSIPQKSVVSWNAMLQGYVVNGENESALELFSTMKTQGPALDSRTYVAALMACGNLSTLDEGKQLHAEVCRLGLETEAFVAGSLVDFYGKCSSMASAQQVFDSTGNGKEDLVVWNALLAGYGRQGDSDGMLKVFGRMKHENIKPGGVTFLTLLNACAHGGLVDEGKRVFEVMLAEYGVEPELEHYQCMIDLLGRANKVDEALAMARSMPYKATVVTWTTLLASCEKWRNVEAGRYAFQSLLRLNDKHGPAYTLMANICSASSS